MKVSAFLRDEKKSCKLMQKKILKDMPAAMPQGKSFAIVAEDIRAKTGDPSVVTKVIWKEKRSGADFQGHIAGPPAHSLLLALTALRDRAHEMARAQK
ncbi:hypothetical protein JADG_007436 [Aureobasidium aubasidani]|nr:hypothetical protein JADG_007436 [Aureobasidium pullulans]